MQIPSIFTWQTALCPMHELMQVFPVSDALCVELCADPNPIFQHLSHLNPASTRNLHLILWNNMGGGGGGVQNIGLTWEAVATSSAALCVCGGGGGGILCAQAFVCVVVSQCVCDYIVDGWVWNARVVCIYSSGPSPPSHNPFVFVFALNVMILLLLLVICSTASSCFKGIVVLQAHDLQGIALHKS